jgi:VIT1/CCC1 family predicted Fe2+/Mn2+ transporter
MTNAPHLDTLVALQRREITQHLICKKLVGVTTDANNQRVLNRIADDELKHYHYWQQHTKQDVQADGRQVWFFYFMARIFGVIFGLKLLEKMEVDAEREYAGLESRYPGTRQILQDEEQHEQELIHLISEERLSYIGSVVLGLNDALVELTGALAGFTLALQDTRLIAAVGLITGIAASLSMAASQYISVKSEGATATKNPLTAALYTGIAYVGTVVLLILPYFLFSDMYVCLASSLTLAILIIFFASFYMSVIQDTPLLRRFAEMVLVSLGVAAFTFLLGYAVRRFLHVDV